MAKISLIDYWVEVISIIEGGLKLDPQRVSAFAIHLAQRLEENGEAKLAQRIRSLTSRAALPAGSVFKTASMLADVEAQLNLVEENKLDEFPQYPILPDNIDTELRRFVTLRKRLADLERKGISPPTSLLLFGPPGCGKTMAAQAISSELKLTLLTVRLEAVIASYLGSSAKNIRRLFDGALTRPSILFLDEFDAIGKMRDDPQEIGEIKRLVSSLLQNLDRVRGRLLVIAATNHSHLLDDALWRRFDVILEFPLPEITQTELIIVNELRENRLPGATLKALTIVASGLSGASINLATSRALQNSILVPDIPISRLLTLEMIRQRKGDRQSIPHEDDIKSLILTIREHVNGKLSMGQIARLIGCSPQNVHRTLSTSREGTKS